MEGFECKRVYFATGFYFKNVVVTSLDAEKNKVRIVKDKEGYWIMPLDNEDLCYFAAFTNAHEGEYKRPKNVKVLAKNTKPVTA